MPDERQPLKIGIQGVRASFHDVAARKAFKGRKIELVECVSFRSLCEALVTGRTDFNIMAIENSIAGSILTNYMLLEQFGSRVVGEVFLRIEMSLMALRGQKIEQLESVQSHPMALLQCQEFLFQYPNLKVVEASDTAESAKKIAEQNLLRQAAIASRLAAEEYGLEILEEGIETNKQNYTRFLIVSQGERYNSNDIPNKASVRFETSHKPGSLLSVLSSFAAHGVNMTKLQSVPIMGRPYEYSFHVDLEWEDYDQYKLALSEVSNKTVSLILLGEYLKDERTKP